MHSQNLALLTAHIHLNKDGISRSCHANRIIMGRMYEILSFFFLPVQFWFISSMNDKEGTKGHRRCMQYNQAFTADYNILRIRASELALNKTENNPSFFLPQERFCFKERKKTTSQDWARRTAISSNKQETQHTSKQFIKSNCSCHCQFPHFCWDCNFSTICYLFGHFFFI